MRKILLLLALAVLPLMAAGAFVYARTAATPQAEAPFVCPVTGEELPCPECCPFQN